MIQTKQHSTQLNYHNDVIKGCLLWLTMSTVKKLPPCEYCKWVNSGRVKISRTYDVLHAGDVLITRNRCSNKTSRLCVKFQRPTIEFARWTFVTFNCSLPPLYSLDNVSSLLYSPFSGSVLPMELTSSLFHVISVIKLMIFGCLQRLMIFFDLIVYSSFKMAAPVIRFIGDAFISRILCLRKNSEINSPRIINPFTVYRIVRHHAIFQRERCVEEKIRTLTVTTTDGVQNKKKKDQKEKEHRLCPLQMYYGM